MISLTIKVVDEDKPGSKYGEELSPGVWSGMLGEVNTPSFLIRVGARVAGVCGLP